MNKTKIALLTVLLAAGSAESANFPVNPMQELRVPRTNSGYACNSGNQIGLAMNDGKITNAYYIKGNNNDVDELAARVYAVTELLSNPNSKVKVSNDGSVDITVDAPDFKTYLEMNTSSSKNHKDLPENTFVFKDSDKGWKEFYNAMVHLGGNSSLGLVDKSNILEIIANLDKTTQSLSFYKQNNKVMVSTQSQYGNHIDSVADLAQRFRSRHTLYGPNSREMIELKKDIALKLPNGPYMN